MFFFIFKYTERLLSDTIIFILTANVWSASKRDADTAFDQTFGRESGEAIK